MRFVHSIGDLARDMQGIARRAPRDLTSKVREGIRTGNIVARDNARRSSGSHGKLYPKAFSSEMHGLSFEGGLGTYSGEYGPDANLPQGGMSFERGSRNQKPHLDLAKSADLIGPGLSREVRDLNDEWFW